MRFLSETSVAFLSDFSGYYQKMNRSGLQSPVGDLLIWVLTIFNKIISMFEDPLSLELDWDRSYWRVFFPVSWTKDVDSYRKSLTSETKKKGAFHPFCKEKKAPSAAPVPAPAPSPSVVAASSTTTKVSREEKEGSAQKKTRRCWSPELHHRFLHALQQLGGSHG